MTVVFGILLSAASAQQSLPVLVSQIQRSIVTIFASDRTQNALSQGTGFFIRGDLIVTNAHVIKNAIHLYAKSGDGQQYAVESVLAEDPDHDLAILRVQGIQKALSIAADLPQVGERVFVIGSPLGLDQTVTEGIVSAIRNVPIMGKVLQISAAISHGSSGSPVINSNGSVIGIATFKLTEGENLNFAIPATFALQMIPQGRARETSAPAPRATATGRDPFIEGMGLIIKQDYAAALPFLELAAAKKTDDPELWFNIGFCHSQLKRYKEAADSYRLAIRLKPSDPVYHLNLGSTLWLLGEAKSAEGEYLEAIRCKPDYAEAYYNLANFCFEHGRVADAASNYQEALRFKPIYGKACIGLANAYKMQSKANEEIATYRRCISAESTLAQAHLGLGTAYLASGDRASALQEYVILKSLDQGLSNELYREIYK